MTRALLALLVATTVVATPAVAADLIIDDVAATPAAVPTGLYATFFAGGSFASGRIDQTILGDPDFTLSMDTVLTPGLFIGGAIGMNVQQNLRGEIELSYMTASIAEMGGVQAPDDYDSTSVGLNLLGNLWYDLESNSGFTPYVGGGLGVGYNETSDDDQVIRSTGLVYQLGAGVRVDVADNMKLDLGYRFRVLHEADVTIDGGGPPPGFEAATNATNHIVQAGLSFAF